jgi:hypothetical protein
MQLLAPDNASANWNDEFASLVTQHTMPPFHPAVLGFIDTVSRRLLLDPALRTMPELAAVAHWMRMAHLIEIKRTFLAHNTGRLRLPRGVVVHFAPANVDSIFLYSWFLSLLMGNSNVVRISTRRGPQIVQLLAVLNEVMRDPKFDMVKNRNLVVSYDHDEAITAVLCSRCNIRVIWGGDETITALRSVPLPPLAMEIAFANRFSLVVLRARAVIELPQDELSGLVRRFFNDKFWFDQLACSSPRLVAWVGPPEDAGAAQERFWPALKSYVCERGIAYPPVAGIDRFTAVCACAALGEVDSLPGKVMDFPARAHLGRGQGRFREYHSGCGLFLETEFMGLTAVLEILGSKDQTLCYYGFERGELEEFAVHLPARSIDRIVPVGRALEFSHTWDGVDLLDTFSRVVDVG